MKELFIILYTYFFDTTHLFCSRQNSVYKIRIFFLYSLYTLLLPFFLLFNIKTINFLGYKVYGFNFRFLQFSFGEIFVKNEYYFYSNKKKPVIVDCGANDGLEIFFFKYLYPNCIIYAFEPDPVTFSLLKKNIELNKLKNVYLYNAAVGEKDGKIPFYVDSDVPGHMMMSLIKDRFPGKEINVPMLSLAKFIKNKNVDLLKMDIEGYEYNIFSDLAKKKSLRGINEIIVECHHHISLTSNRQFTGLLLNLEEAGFDFQLNSSIFPIYSKNKFQDILVFAYRN